jgi:hypothetical protein
MYAAKTLATVSLLALAIGCNEKKQTYTEAVQLYDMEMRELERLEKRRAELTPQPDASAGTLDQVKLARDLLGKDAGQMQKALRDAAGGLITDEDAKKTDKAIEDHLKLIDQQINAEAEKKAAPPPKSDESLAEIDEQITKQKARVEAARQAKEALAP